MPETDVPIMPILNPASWRGGDAYARRLFGSRDPEAHDPWVAIVAVSPDSNEMLVVQPDIFAEVIGRPMPHAEAEALAVQCLHIRMNQDPAPKIAVKDGLVTATWEDFAASLILHPEIRKAIHGWLGASEVLVAIPTRETLYAASIDQIELVERLVEEVIALVGLDHALTDALFVMEAGELTGMMRR